MQNVTVTVRKAGESHVNNPTIVTVSINSTATAAGAGSPDGRDVASTRIVAWPARRKRAR